LVLLLRWLFTPTFRPQVKEILNGHTPQVGLCENNHMGTPTVRQAYLDWLRIMAIIGVLVFHAAMAFVAEWEWHIKNKETSYLLLEFNFWLSRFRMPLLFFISGAVCFFIIQKKSGGQFIGLRFRRLFLPLLFGMLIVVPPQVYLERVTQGYTGNYLQFYGTLFTTGAYPAGNLSWHHLWFILYLFVYDVVCAPLFVWTLSEKGKNWLQRLHWLSKGKNIYLLMLPSVIWRTSLTLRFPSTHDFINDWCDLFYWLFFLLAGFLCITQSGLMDSLERNRRTSLALAFLTFIAINVVRWNDSEPWDTLLNWRSDGRTYAYLSLYAITAWCWVFAAIGYGKKYLNRTHRILQYANEAVYPFYILHQTIIVVIVFYVVQVEESILAKYLFTTVLSLLVSMLIYHLFIRPYGVMRFLFGMKPKTKATRKELPTEPEKAAPTIIAAEAIQIS
jgi:glucan biosynthesis protein C